MPDNAQRGLAQFETHCVTCHAGKFQTDHSFHAMGVPQFGPGKAARFESHARDVGRMRVTGSADDAYAFRTPSLRNVVQTAPYGHTGAYATLPSFISAHINPASALETYSREAPILPAFQTEDWWVFDRPEELEAIQASVTYSAVHLTKNQINEIIAFLETLSDPIALNGRLGIPHRVPSGLAIDR